MTPQSSTKMKTTFRSRAKTGEQHRDRIKQEDNFMTHNFMERNVTRP